MGAMGNGILVFVTRLGHRGGLAGSGVDQVIALEGRFDGQDAPGGGQNVVAASLADSDAAAAKAVDIEVLEKALCGENRRMGFGIARNDPDLALGPLADLVGCEVKLFSHNGRPLHFARTRSATLPKSTRKILEFTCRSRGRRLHVFSVIAIQGRSVNVQPEQKAFQAGGRTRDIVFANGALVMVRPEFLQSCPHHGHGARYHLPFPNSWTTRATRMWLLAPRGPTHCKRVISRPCPRTDRPRPRRR